MKRFSILSISLGIALTALLALPAVSVVIPGDPADGRIMTNYVYTGGAEIGVGHYGDTNATFGSTAIFFFELPDPSAFGGTLHNAALFFTLDDKSGSFASYPGDADVWGLGYVAEPTINPAWFLTGDTDTSTGVNIGTNQVVKIADDFMVGNRTFDPQGGGSRIALPDPSLADFIELLYANGASAGDYAIVRMSIDVPSSGGNRRYNISTADEEDATRHPELRLNESTVLLRDRFDDGDRTDGADPRDTDWYRIYSSGSDSLILSVTNDAVNGIGNGNALSVDMDWLKQRVVGHFPPVTLAEPGDFIQMRFKFRSPEIRDPGFDYGRLRMALLGSNGSPTGADTGSTPQNYSGYLIRLSMEGNPVSSRMALVNNDYGSSFLNADDFLSDIQPVSITTGVTYSLMYTITRSLSTQMTTRLVFNDVVLVGDDPGTDQDPADIPFYDSFDAIGLGTNPDGEIDFYVDDVEVLTSLPNVVPHSALAADVVEATFETESLVRYGVEEATDLVAENWADTGFTIVGSGGELVAQDAELATASKAYRLVNHSSSSSSAGASFVIFDENLNAFGSALNGDWVAYAPLVVAPPNPFNDGNALHMWDTSASGKVEAQGETGSSILSGFEVTMQAQNQSGSSDTNSAIRFRMGNAGKSMSSESRAAFSLSWFEGGDFSASYGTVSGTVDSVRTFLGNATNEVKLVANGTVNLDYVYTNSAMEVRTLSPLSYDLYIDDVLLNDTGNFPEIPNTGLPFAEVPEYTPESGIQRFALIGATTANMANSVWFDNVVLTPFVINANAQPMTAIASVPGEGFSYDSEAGTVYELQYSTNATSELPDWIGAGIEARGDGAPQAIFDPAGLTGVTYRIVEQD